MPVGQIAWNKGTAKTVDKVCVNCLKKFTVPLYRDCARFCSQKCTPTWNKGLKGIQVAWNKGVSNVWAIGYKNTNWKGGISKETNYILFKNRQYRYRKKNSVGSHSYLEWEQIKKDYNYTCLSCKKVEPEIKLTEDHIIPLSKGGSNYIDNIQPLCNVCNAKKGTNETNFKNQLNNIKYGTIQNI